jgi:hypothetical protein
MTIYTPRLGLPKPEETETPDGPVQIGALADALDDAALFDSGAAPPDPATTTVTFFLRTTDDHVLVNTGSAWIDIGPSAIADGSLTNAKFADDSVNQRVLAPGSVGTGEIIDGTIATGDLANAIITAAKVADALKPSTGAVNATEALRALGLEAGKAAPGTHAGQHAPETAGDPIMGISKAQLAAAVRNALFQTGDLKWTTRSAAPADWILALGQNVAKAAYPALWAVAQAEIAAGNQLFADVDANNFRVADCQARIPIPVGTHADVNVLGKNDGLAVAKRKTKHSHSRGSLSTTGAGGHVHVVYPFVNGGGSDGSAYLSIGHQSHVQTSDTVGATDFIGDHAHGLAGSIGDLGAINNGEGVQDDVPHIVLNLMIYAAA